LLSGKSYITGLRPPQSASADDNLVMDQLMKTKKAPGKIFTGGREKQYTST